MDLPNKQLRFVNDLKALAQERHWPYRTGLPAGIQLSLGSRTIPPVLQRLLHQAPKLMADYYHARRADNRQAASKQFTNLLATRQHVSPESFTCRVPGALVAGPEGLVITDRGEILMQAITRVVHDRGEIKVIVAFSRPSSAPRLRITRPCLSLITLGRIAYAHWTVQALPRLDWAGLGMDPSDLCFLVPAEVRPFQRQALELLGITADRLIGIPTGHNALVDQLEVCCVESSLFKPKADHLLAVRDRLWQAAGIDPKGGTRPDRRLYVSRAKAKRPVVNEHDLLPVLRAFGFEVVILEDLTLADQIRLVADAQMLCGPHGAGMYNSIYARPGATVIELFNPVYWDVSSVRIASYAHTKHWHMLGENASQDFATYVDPKILHQLLDTIMRCQGVT